MDGDAANIVIANFALARVQSRADFDAQRSNLFGNCARAAYSACRSIESGQNAVASRLDFVPAEAIEVTSDCSVMGIKQIVPTAVAECSAFLGGPTKSVKKTRTNPRSTINRPPLPVQDSPIRSAIRSAVSPKKGGVVTSPKLAMTRAADMCCAIKRPLPIVIAFAPALRKTCGGSRLVARKFQ